MQLLYCMITCDPVSSFVTTELEYNCNILHHPDQNSGSGAERELSGLLLGQTAGTGAQLYQTLELNMT